MNPQQWFIREDDREVGPLSPVEVRALISAGRITRTTPIRPAARTTFVAADTIAGLMPPELVSPPVPDQEVFETIEPRHEAPQSRETVPNMIHVDPSANAADLFENYAPPSQPILVAAPAGVASGSAVSAVSYEIEESAPRTTPARTAPAVAFAPKKVQKPQPEKLLEAAYLLETPAWKNLWPLATLTLFLGWIIGGFLTFERLYAPDSMLPVVLLAAGGVPVALAAIIHYLRPQRIPIATAIGVALFTAVIGIFMLLVLQSLADAAVHTRRAPVGRGSIIWAIFAAIGAAYEAIHSENVLVRWLGYVFGVGLCEEATKLLPLALLVMWRSDRHLSVHTFLCLGFISGLGFGIGEALYGYAPWSSVYAVSDNVIRWYSAVPSHAIYTTVCAAFLWRLADQLENAEGFWERAIVIGMAVGVMALVHGTYNTVCSFGVAAALVMEALSFVLLIWAVRWVTVDATEPPGLPPSAWAMALARPMPIRFALGGAVVVLVLAMACGSSREDVLPAILRAELPSEVRPYVDGVTIKHAGDGTALAIPLTVQFTFTRENLELVGRFTNHGPQALRKLIVTCYSKSEDAAGEVIDLGELLAGDTVEINEERGWTFAPGERLSIQADGYLVQSLMLP